MPKLRTLSYAAALMACSAAPALAQNQPLDMRPGLWEITTQRSTAGMPKMAAIPAIPPEALARMPAAQRAQLEAALKARQNAASGKSVSKICITPASLGKRPDFGIMREANCQRTKYTRTAQGWQLQEVCHRGGRDQVLDVNYRAVNRETLEGAVNIAMHGGPGNLAITMKQASHGRWLSPDCGTVKPVE